jgi:hypothetical protein
MSELQSVVSFDPKLPVYVIKQFFYGTSNSSIRHPSDHPLRLDQIPVDKRTGEYIKQGKVRSNIPTMIVNEDTSGIVIDPNGAIAIETNPLQIPELVDKGGERVPASAPMAVRQAAKQKADTPVAETKPSTPETKAK